MVTWRHVRAFTMAVIAAAGLGLVVLAAIHGAATSRADDNFVRKISDLGIGYTSPQAVINTAHNVCRALGKGDTAVAVRQTILHHTHLAGDQAIRFVTAAVSAYCPQYSGRVSA